MRGLVIVVACSVGCASARVAEEPPADAAAETFDVVPVDSAAVDTTAEDTDPGFVNEFEDSAPPPMTQPPFFTPPPGTYICGPLSVSMGSSSAGTTIHFTVDGSTPTTSSAVYSAPLSIARTTTLRAFAVGPLGSSEINSGPYTINVMAMAPSAPTLAPATGAYVSDVTVTLSKAGMGVICFTTDGSDPSCVDETTECATGAQYAAPFVVTPTKAGVQVRAVTCSHCYAPPTSAITSATYRSE